MIHLLVSCNVRNEKLLYPIAPLKRVETRQFIHARSTGEEEKGEYFYAPGLDQARRWKITKHFGYGNLGCGLHLHVGPKYFVLRQSPTCSVEYFFRLLMSARTFAASPVFPGEIL